MQLTWKPWLHFGRMRNFSPFVKSERHITHSVSKPGLGFDDDDESLITKSEHLKAHLMIAFNPKEQISAHRRTERTMTTLASKELFPRYKSLVGGGEES